MALNNQLLLTSKAEQVKMSHLLPGSDIYLFDRSLVQASSVPIVSKSPPTFETHVVKAFPKPNHGQSDKSVLSLRSQWALSLLTQAHRLNSEMKILNNEINVIKKANKVAILQMKSHSRNLEKSFRNVEDYAAELKKGSLSLVNSKNVSENFDSAKTVKLIGPTAFGARQYLSDWVDKVSLDRLLGRFKNEFPATIAYLDSLTVELNSLSHDTDSLAQSADAWIKNTNPSTLYNNSIGVLGNLELLATNLQKSHSSLTDFNDSGTVQSDGTNLREKDDDSLISIQKLAEEVRDLHEAVSKAKLQAVQHSLRVLQNISQLQSRSTKFKPKLTEVGNELMLFESQRVEAMKQVDIEFVYGSLLVEMLRRTEWCAKAFSHEDNVTVQRLKEDEMKRRLQWRKQFGDTFEFVSVMNEQEDLSMETMSTQTPSIVHNLSLSRLFVQTYIDGVSNKETASSLDKALSLIGAQRTSSSLSKAPVLFPASQKSLFRNGSIGGSLIQSEKLQTASIGSVDERIRGYEARIRKLEDLLHKQRLSNGILSPAGYTVTPSSSPSIASPFPGRNSASPPPSAGDMDKLGAMERQLAQEQAENERLRQEVSALHGSLNSVENSRDNAESEKSDLMANMASLESDFSRERRSMVQEISELRLRVEELEYEVERAQETSLERHQQKDHETEELEERLKALTLRHNEANGRLATLEDENVRSRTVSENSFVKIQDLSQRIYTSYKRSCVLLESLGLQAQKEYDISTGEVISFEIHRVKGLRKKHRKKKSPTTDTDNAETPSDDDFKALYWMNPIDESTVEEDKYRQFLAKVFVDYDLYVEKVAKRFEDLEHLARKLQKEARNYRTMTQQLDEESKSKIALNHFKVGDLVLFLPTRDPSRTPQPWAAFNVGAPHFFLKQKDNSDSLKDRDWLVGRISGIEERIVQHHNDRDENPFDLSEGLRWYYLEAVEEK